MNKRKTISLLALLAALSFSGADMASDDRLSRAGSPDKALTESADRGEAERTYPVREIAVEDGLYESKRPVRRIITFLHHKFWHHRYQLR